MSIFAKQIYEPSSGVSKLLPNYFQTIFDHLLQKMKEGSHNRALKLAVKHLRTSGKIRWDKDIAEKTGYSKGTVSEYLRGIEPASQEFTKEFEKQFGISLEDFQNPNPGNPPLSLEGLRKYTLQDYINKVEEHNAFLQRVIESNLGGILRNQQLLYGYARTTLGYHAAIASQGDKKKERELLGSLNNMIQDARKADLGDENQVLFSEKDK